MQTQSSPRFSGMTGFILIWIGQVVSVLASGMSGFALSIWMFQETRSATAMGLMQVCFILPFLLLSPAAGVMVDRYNRKWMMALSDLTAVTATFGLLALQYFGRLEYWHMYAANVIFGLGNTFQWPAYSSAITLMVKKEDYGRANGLMSLMEAGPGVLAPLLAGALLPLIQLEGILLLDVLTFFVALGALMVVFVPQPERSEEGQAGKGSFLKEAAYGFEYIFKRPSLLGLQLVFFFCNLFTGIGITVLMPMILLRTADNTTILGAVQSAGAIGMVAGGILMSVWRGFKRRVNGVIFGWLFSGIFFISFGLSRSLPFWLVFAVLAALVGPLVNTSNQAIWQAKVAPDVQGRVFSSRRLIAWFSQPVSPLIAGLLADRWLEPGMASGQGWLAGLFGGLFGTAPGSGMALLYVLAGGGVVLVSLGSYLLPFIRNVETSLPDHV